MVLKGNEVPGKRWVTRKRKGDEDVGPRAGRASRWDVSWKDHVAPESLSTHVQEQRQQGSGRRYTAVGGRPPAGGSPAAPPAGQRVACSAAPWPEGRLQRRLPALPSAPKAVCFAETWAFSPLVPAPRSFLQTAEFNFRVLAEARVHRLQPRMSAVPTHSVGRGHSALV